MSDSKTIHNHKSRQNWNLVRQIQEKPKNEVSITIPRDPQEFYVDFGFLSHPRLKDAHGKPLLVEKLTQYQREFWGYNGNALAIKSQKIGLTTTTLLEDFQFVLLEEGAGKDVLIIAQNQLLANDHIRTLKRLIHESKKYSQFMITSSDEVFREEKTKISTIFIRNPHNPKMSSRIIGLGQSESSVWSWKNVGRVHMSDVSKLDIKDQKNFFAAVYSRLANTGGIVKIETPPNGQEGEVYNIYLRSINQVTDSDIVDGLAEDPQNTASKFKIFVYPAHLAVDAGIIPQEFLDQEHAELGDLLFAQLYQCSFLPSSNQWYRESMFHSETYEVEF